MASLDATLAALVREAVDASVAPLVERLAALEAKVEPPLELLNFQDAAARMNCDPEIVSRAVAEGWLKAVPISPTTKRVCWPPVAVGEGA
jgi:hypothetical protein